MLRTLFSALLLSCAGLAQTPPPVEVPTFPNATCPIMGKKVSLPLYVDTDLGRIYVCCKPCFRKVLADVATAHKTAYPIVQELDNKVCPVSGEAIGTEAVAVTLQGFRFKVCCQGCVDTARANSQLILTKLERPKLVDIGNRKCPITAEATTAQNFVIIQGKIVHLSSAKTLEKLNEDPAAALKKAEAIAKEQTPPAKHVHSKRERLQAESGQR